LLIALNANLLFPLNQRLFPGADDFIHIRGCSMFSRASVDLLLKNFVSNWDAGLMEDASFIVR